MVTYVTRWDIRRDRVGDYADWARAALGRLFATGDVIEFRGYRPVSGSSEVVASYEFKDMAGFANWYDDDEVQAALTEAREYCENMTSEIWGPSPVAPEPIRPQR